MTETLEQQLVATLEQQVEVSTRLLDALQAERAALTDRKLEAFEQTIGSKQDCIAQFKQLETRLRTLLASARSAPETLDAFLEHSALPADHRLHALRAELRALAERCRTANQINGKIIETSRVQTQQLLQLLTGQPQAGVYGASGKTENTRSSTLAKA